MNETKPLTAQQLALYLGCECETGSWFPKFIGTRVLIAVDIATDQVRINFGEGEDQHWLPCRDVKPTLRPLSNITKEEIADLFEVKGTILRGNYDHPFFQIQYNDLNGLSRFEHRYITQLSPAQVVFLLGKHFDLFGWIEAGLAIDKTKLP